MKIDCSQCEMYRSEHCADCLVTAVLQPPSDVVEIDGELDESLGALQAGGLLPVLRFRPRPPGDEAPGAGEVAAG